MICIENDSEWIQCDTGDVAELIFQLSSLREERDQARGLAIKVEGRYQDVLKELAELRAKIEMLTTPDPDLDGERGFYEGL